jgi:hypothetical protein
MNGVASGGLPFTKDSFSALPDLDADNADDGIDTDVDLGASYGAPPPLPVHSIPSPPTHRSRSNGAGSAGSFADFVSAPPPPRRARRTRGSLLAGGSRTASNSGSAAGSSSTGPSEGEDDEVSSTGTGTSRTRT